MEQKSLDFLRDLVRHNNREWFNANKKRYESDLKEPFQELVGQLIHTFQSHDPALQIEPKKCIFRIYRDTRFSKDKNPYKEHVGAIISPQGTKGKEYPGFYIHLEPGRLMIGGGAYFLERPTLMQLRQFIMLHPGRLEDILAAPDFVEKYETLQGERNKRLPKEMMEAARTIPVLFNKQFYYMAEMPAETVLRDDFMQLAETYYLAARPLNDYLVEGMGMS